MNVALTSSSGSTLCMVTTQIETNPSFKSGDLWLVDLHVDQEDKDDPATAVTVVKIWINPEDGTILVTPIGMMKRQPFTLVSKWLVRLSS